MSKDYCLENYHAFPAGNDLRQAGAILHQRNQLMHQAIRHVRQQKKIVNQAAASLRQ